MSDLKAQIEISADASGVEAGVGRAKRSLSDLGATASTAGKEAADSFSKIGDNGTKLAFTVDKSTKDLARSIERATSAMSAGAKGTREYFESLANQRGVDAAALKPFLDQLSDATTKARLAADANKKLEESTRFLDSLKSRSDAIGKTASELAALRAAELGVADAAAPMIAKLRESEQAATRFGKAMDSVVGYAKAAAGAALAYVSIGSAIEKFNASLDVLAKLDDMAQKTGSTVENLSKLQKVASAFGTDFGTVDGAITKLAKGMATVDSETNKANKALDALGIKSRDVTGKLRDPSAVMVDVAKSLQDYEDSANKAAIVTDLFGKSGAELLPYLNDLAENVDKFGGSTAEAAKQASDFQDRLGQMRVKSEELYTSVAVALLPTLTDFVDALSDVKKESDSISTNSQLTSWVDDLAVGLARVFDVAKVIPQAIRAIGGSFEAVGADIELLNYLKSNANPIAAGAKLIQGRSPNEEMKAALEKRNKIVEDANKRFSDLWNQPANSMEQAMLNRIAGRQTGSESAVDSISKILGGGGSKKALGYQSGKEGKDGKDGVSEQVSDYERLIKTINEKIAIDQLELTSSAKVTEAEKVRAKMYADLAAGAIKLTEKEKAMLNARLDVLDTLDKSKVAAAEVAKIYADYNSEAKKAIETAEREAEAHERLASTYGMTKAQVEALTLAELENELANRSALGLTSDRIEALEKLIEAKKRSVAALAQVDVMDQAKKLSEQWKRDFDRIEDWIGDAIARGVTKGKDIWKSLIDGLKASFARLVLSPIISPIAAFGASLMNPMSAQAQGLTGGADLLSSFSNASSLFTAGKTMASAFTSGVGATFGNMVSAFGNTFGSSAISAFGSGMSLSTSAAQTAAAAYQGAGMAGTGSALSAGASFAQAIPVIGLIIAGMMKNGSLYDQGWDINNGTVPSWVKNPIVSPMTAVPAVTDKILQGLGLSGKTAAILSGSAGIAKLFGQAEVGSGYLGSVNGGDFSGSAYKFMKGGVFRNSKTQTSELAAETDAFFSEAVSAAYDGFADLGTAVGAGSDLLKDFSYSFRLALADFDEAGKQREIQRFMSSMTDSMALAFVDSFRTSVDKGAQASSRFFTNTSDGEAGRPDGTSNIVAQTRVSSPLDPYIDDMLRLFDTFKSSVAGVEGAEGKLSAFVAQLFSFGDALADNQGYLKQFGEALDFDKLEAAAAKGESVMDTFARLNTIFTATNDLARSMGKDIDTAFGAVGLASTEARQRLIDFAGGLEAFVAGNQFFSQNFLPDDRRMAPVISQVDEVLGSVGWAGIRTKEEFVALVDSLDLSTDAGAKANAALKAIAPAFLEVANYVGTLGDKAAALGNQSFDLDQQILALNDVPEQVRRLRAQELAALDPTLRAQQLRIWALEDEKTALEAVRTNAADAFSGLQRAVEAERTRVTDAYQSVMDSIASQIDTVSGSVSKLSSLSSSLRSTVNSMRLDSQLGMDRAAASAQIQAALAIAKAGGVLPDAEALQSALSVVAQPNEQLYASFVDFQRNYLKDKNAIADLADLTDAQLSIEEQTLKALEAQRDSAEKAYQQELSRLDGILTNAQLQLDTLNGIKTGILSIPEALAAFALAVKAPSAPAAGRPATGGGSVDTSNPNYSVIDSLYESLLGRDPDADGASFWSDKLNAGESVWSVVEQIKNSDEYKNKLPQFAVGTNYVPRDMVAMIHEGEAIVPKAYNPAANVNALRSANNNAELAAELRAMKAEMAALLKQISAETRSTAVSSNTTAKAIKRVMQGGSALKVQEESA